MTSWHTYEVVMIWQFRSSQLRASFCSLDPKCISHASGNTEFHPGFVASCFEAMH